MSLDNELLSAYLDREIPDRFRDEIEKRIQTDSDLQARFMKMMELQDRVRQDPEPDFEASKERIWRRFEVRRLDAVRPRFLERRIELPTPVVLAATMVLVVMFGLLVFTFTTRQDSLAPIAELPPSYRFGADLSPEQLFQVLGISEHPEEITISLPDAPRFQFHSAPALVRPAEYRRIQQ